MYRMDSSNCPSGPELLSLMSLHRSVRVKYAQCLIFTGFTVFVMQSESWGRRQQKPSVNGNVASGIHVHPIFTVLLSTDTSIETFHWLHGELNVPPLAGRGFTCIGDTVFVSSDLSVLSHSVKSFPCDAVTNRVNKKKPEKAQICIAGRLAWRRRESLAAWWTSWSDGTLSPATMWVTDLEKVRTVSDIE